MYGMRAAPHNCEHAYVTFPVVEGLAGGISSPRVFHHREKGHSACVVVADQQLELFRGVLHTHFELKPRGIIGLGQRGNKCVRIPKQVVECGHKV
jgi:uncharacterized membrane protein